jgi:hypothetical protein
MEHRCGRRVRMSLGARLGSPSRSLFGRVVDLSLSGAFVALPDPIPEQTRLVVEVAARGGFGSTPWRVPAHVVRRSESGVGIEWDEFAPWPVLALLRREGSSGTGPVGTFSTQASRNGYGSLGQTSHA